jgi:6-pyruvoyltetrahydropterin/6-carboxytetrahydropterin synthase
MERYQIRVGKDHLIFCCGHFISFAGDQCEPLHGHNYRAAVEIEGGLDENYYLFDFITLKRLAKVITDELNHRMLVATRNAHIKVEDTPERVRLTHRDREWVFPRGDCALLPIENTTAELLATYIGLRLLERLKAECKFTPELMRVEVEENIGHSATWVWVGL